MGSFHGTAYGRPQLQAARSLSAPKRRRRPQSCMLGALAALFAPAQAQTVAATDPAATQQVDVTGHYINSLGSNDAASAGTITRELIENRPLLRPGDVLEYVPGMIVTQHCGDGKANQYFLRGFNLDHGTDFATWVAGMPVNMPTHAPRPGLHRPQLPHSRAGLAACDYSKGPYYAEVGDFASAGRREDRLRRPPAAGIATADLRRLRLRARAARRLAANSGRGDRRLRRSSTQHNDGPWDVPTNFNKCNGVLRYTRARGERLQRDGDGLQRRVELDRPDPAARGRRRA